MGVPSDGSYGIDEGLIAGFPCTCDGGEWSIVEDLEIDEFSRERIDASVNELREERAAVQKLACSSARNRAAIAPRGRGVAATLTC